ncbi:hypothetical protein [uncultured Adlercreutzia sp.]|uniref:hypothetical protein n=1 Tax=uncultured Adlercreutzia sp. TaxID=875803 RepID=UPI0026766F0F|nr:hypothetical protein [uncultured Adlercreutzia sp.]
MDEEKKDAAQSFELVLSSAARLPGVRIDREKYLVGALGKKFSLEVVATAVESSPAAAGIKPEELSHIADASIRYESTKVTAISAVAGIPGGFAMAGAVPADLAQYFAHVLRITQKLAFLYGWDHIFEGTEEEIDDETKNLLILFIGVMFGANGATDAVTKISNQVAAAVARKLPQKALTKGAIYPIVKKVAGYIGVKMTKDIFAKGVSKVIPFIGGVISGGITLATYAPMCLKLKDYLAGLEVANPDTYVVKTIAVEDVEEYEA